MRERYLVIDSLKDQYPIKTLCGVLEVSRSGYYEFITRPNKDKNIEELVSYIYHQYKGVLGVRGITLRIREDYCWHVNHKRVHRVMKKLGLKAVIRKKNPYKRYRQKSAGIIYNNLLNRDFYAKRPNEKWVTDITEFKVANQTLYLSAIMDLYNNEMIAYKTSHTNDIALVESTLREASKKRETDTDTILHSDQGMQYRSNKYNQLVTAYNLTPSMSRKGTCLDNACIEGFFSHFKAEAFTLFPCDTIEKAYKTVDKYIDYYNKRRYQWRLNGMSPFQYFNWNIIPDIA